MRQIGATLQQISELPDELTYCVVNARGSARPSVTVQSSLAFVTGNWMMEVLGGDLTLAETSFVGTWSLDADVPDASTKKIDIGPLAGKINNRKTPDAVYKLTLPVTFAETARME